VEHILVIFSYLCISQWLIDVKVKQRGPQGFEKIVHFSQTWKVLENSAGL